MTNKGTERPWERPGQAAQEPNAKLADSETRSRQYEDRIGGVDRTAYQQTSTPAGSVSPAGPQTSNAAKEGRVGDPLPIALLLIVAVPIVLLIAGVIWWAAH